MPTIPIPRATDRQMLEHLLDVFGIGIDDFHTVTVVDGFVTFHMTTGANATVTFQVRPHGKTGPRM